MSSEQHECELLTTDYSLLTTIVMPTKIAAILSLMTFAISLLVGTFDAQNSLVTIVWRAILMMGLALVIGYIVGIMAETMLNQHLSDLRKNFGKKTEEPSENRR